MAGPLYGGILIKGRLFLRTFSLLSLSLYYLNRIRLMPGLYKTAHNAVPVGEQ